MNEFPESQDRDHPDDLPPDCAPETLAMIEDAWEALEADEVELAVQRFQEARDLEPDNPAIDVEMGDALFEMGRLDEVIQLMRAVLAVAPTTPRANRLLAMALHDRGEHSEALPLFETEAERTPDDPHIHVSLGDALAALGRRDEAIAAYRHALRLDPTLWSAHHGWGHCLALDENFAAAIDHFQAALAVEENAPEVWLAWGEMLITLRDWAGAREKLLNAVEIDEEYAEAWESLSFVCDHLDDREEAHTTLRRAIFWNSDREEMIDYLATRYHPHLAFARSWDIVLSGHYVYPDAIPPARTRSHQFRRSYQVWAPDEKTALDYIEDIEGAMWPFRYSIEEIVPGAVAHSCHGGVVVFSDRLYESTLPG